MNASMSRPLIETPIDVRWGDMDAFGHVNNAVYATYLEEARLRWFATVPGDWQSAETGPVVAAQSFNFRQPIEWPAALTVELTAERCGNSSVTMGFRIVSRDLPQKFYADGSVVMVWIDRRTGKSTALPENIRRGATGR